MWEHIKGITTNQLKSLCQEKKQAHQLAEMDSVRRERAKGFLPTTRRSTESQYQPQEFMGYNPLQEVVTITKQQLSHCLESMDTHDSPEEVYKQVYNPMRKKKR